jgi:hypothetical protein
VQTFRPAVEVENLALSAEGKKKKRKKKKKEKKQ